MASPVVYPVTEPTSAQNFGTLIGTVAYKLGISNYGTSGTAAPAIPTDPHNLAICQTIVNDAIRMLIADAPAPSGWFFGKPVCQVDLWPEIGPDPTGGTYVSSTSTSTGSTFILNLTTGTPPSTVQMPSLYVPNFVQSMEERQIWLAGVPSTGTLGWFVPPNSPLSSTSTGSTIGIPFTIVNFLGPSQIEVFGNPSSLSSTLASTYANKIPFAFAATGDYTLPADFGGEVAGEITFIAQTNRGMVLAWTDETNIRQRRQNYNIESGTPYHAAVRIMQQPTYALMSYTPPRRRWELLTWRITSEFLSVLFPYVLSFNNLVNNTDLPPTPLSLDDLLMSACRAQAERYQQDSISGPEFQYYLTRALPAAYKINSRGANRSIGYCGSGLRQMRGMNIEAWRDWNYQRPPVGVL